MCILQGNKTYLPTLSVQGGPKTPLYLKSQCHYNMKGLKFGLLGPILRILWGPTIFWLKPWCWGQLRNYILRSKVSWCFTIYVMCSIYRRLTTKSLIPVLEIPTGSRPTTLEEDREHFVNFMFTIWDSRHEDLQLFWLSFKHCLTHWGRVTHICVSDLTSIGSDNDLSPGGRQAIIRTNAGILLIRPLGTNFSEFLVEILIFSLKKMRLKVSSTKRPPFCLGLNELIHVINILSSLWILTFHSTQYEADSGQYCN